MEINEAVTVQVPLGLIATAFIGLITIVAVAVWNYSKVHNSIAANKKDIDAAHAKQRKLEERMEAYESKLNNLAQSEAHNIVVIDKIQEQYQDLKSELLRIGSRIDSLMSHIIDDKGGK